MHTKTHRHFVAFPLAVFLMLTVAGFDTAFRFTSANLGGSSSVRFAALATPTDFQVGWMLSGTLEPESALRTDASGEHPELVRGQVLLQSEGFSQLSAGTVKVSALSASYVVLRDDASVTVAALSSFVIVGTGTDTVVLAPGMQLTVRSDGATQTATIPPDWYAEKSQAAKILPSRDLPETSSPQVTLAGLLRDGRVTLAAFSSAVSAAQELDATGNAVRVLLLRVLQEDSQTDTDASTMISMQIAEDAFLSSALAEALPLAVATLRKPVAEPHIHLWEKSALSLGLTDSAAALSLLHRFAKLPETLRRAGYPQQSIMWQNALSYVGTTLRTTLSEQELQTLDADLVTIHRHESFSQSETKQTAVAYVPATSWSESELVAIVREALFTHRVLMAVSTQLAPDTPTQTVRVTGVFMAEQGTDVPYAFTFDVARSLITDIQRNGKELPNAVPPDVFFR